MKRFLLLLCLTTLIYSAQSQTTYYWVGGSTASSIKTNSNWNTALNGSGTVRTVNGIDDILIFDGSNIGGATATTGTINANVTTDSSSKFILQNNANVIFSRPAGGGGTGTLSLIGGPGAIYSIVFKSTAVCTLSTTPSTSGYPFGSATQGVNNGIVFQSGATLITSGTYSPMGGTSTHQAALLLPGSKYYIKSTNAASTGSWTSNKYFGNVYVQNGATLTCDGSTLYMENLTVDAGCTFVTHTSGSTPIMKNLVVNGTMTSPPASTNSIVMGGDGAQTITGTGTIDVASFLVSEISNTTISKNLNIANTATIFGKLDFGASNVISGTGTFSSKGSFTPVYLTGNVVTDSFRVSVTSAPSGITGSTVTGAGIQPNTTVVATSTGNLYIILSKPAIATNAATTLTFTSGASTLTTSNPNGFDSTSGSVTVVGKKTFQAGTNYVINTATTKPIGITSGQDSAMTVGNLTLNAPVTTNINTRVNGVLTLNTGKLTLRETDTVRIATTGSIAGGPFDNTKYIALNAAAGKVGALKIDSFSLPKVFPIGTATDYLPVRIQSTGTAEFIASVFQGVTNDGSMNGTPLTASQKANAVDAVWNINRLAGTSMCEIGLWWTNNLEGSNFSGFTNAQIEAANYNRSLGWKPPFLSTPDNASNNIYAVFATFGPIAIGKKGDLLPVKLYNLKATVNNNDVNVSWSVSNEIDMNKYVVERSNDGRNFETVGEVLALNKNENNYHITNNNVVAGTYYYRLVSVDKTGKTTYSQMLKVNNQAKLSVSVYPNPASKEIVVAGIANGASMQITDAIGKVVYKKIATAQTQVIETNNLPVGLYFVNITQVDGTKNAISFIKK